MTSGPEGALVLGGRLRLASTVGLAGLAAGFYASERVHPPDRALVGGSVAGLLAFVVVVLG